MLEEVLGEVLVGVWEEVLVGVWEEVWISYQNEVSFRPPLMHH